MEKIIIQNHIIDNYHSPFIISEVGLNHNGEIDKAFKMIELAKQAGSDSIKFQTFKAENLATKNAQKATYQKETTNIEQSQFDMLKKLELNIEIHKELISYCGKKKNNLFIISF